MKKQIQEWLATLFTHRGMRGPVLTLLTGSGAALTLAYLSQPILRRLYTAAEYGVMDYFVAVVATLMSISSLRYEDGLMLPHSDKDAGEVLWLALGVLTQCCLLMMVCFLWRDPIATFLGMPEVAPYLLLVPPTVFIIRVSKIGELWLTRKECFWHINAAQVSNTATMVTTRVGMGVPPVSAGTEGLVSGYILGVLVSFSIVVVSVVRRFGQRIRTSFSWSGIFRAAKRYRRFPLFSTPSSLMAVLIIRLPILLLPLFFMHAEAIVGLLASAINVLIIPLSYVNAAISRVFFVRAAEAQREDRLTEISALVHQRLVMLGLFPTLILVLAGPDIFEIAFGASWREAGTYIQYIGLWLFIGGVASSLTRIFDVTERQRLDFVTSIFIFVCMSIALLLGGRSGEVTTMLLLLGILGASARIVQLCILLRLARVRLRAALRTYGRYLFFSTPGLLLISAALWFFEAAWITTIVSVVAMASYTGLVLWKDRLLPIGTSGK